MHSAGTKYQSEYEKNQNADLNFNCADARYYKAGRRMHSAGNPYQNEQA